MLFFTFPIFAIAFLVAGHNRLRDLLWLILASLVFDFFSGFEFGFLTGLIIILAPCIQLTRKFLTINSRSLISLLFFSIIFSLGFFFLLMFQLPPRHIFSRLPQLLVQSAVISLMVAVVLVGLNRAHDVKKIQN